MSKRKYYILFTLSFVFFTFQLTAQERIIHGIVTTFDSIPLIEASVTVRSTKQTVLTDALGNFSVGCDYEDKLKVTANGFYNQNVKLKSNTKFAAINIKLKPGAKSREHAIGYGHVSDADKLNAVASINKDDVDFSQYSDMLEVIRGRFAGVQVVGGEIIIRGVNSINSSSAALIIIDGVASDYGVLNSISPIQVKSINVIKDGSAAIYGSRGANGVVIIETKRGGD